MNKIIALNGETYAILVSSDEIKDGSEWFGENFESLQASRMKYPAGKEFRAHKHLMNPRIIKRTQEAFVVIKGRITIDIFSDDKKWIGTFGAGPGEAILVYKGYHWVSIIEDSICYEIKAGQFTVVSEDKTFLND